MQPIVFVWICATRICWTAFFQQFRPTAVIHTAALADPQLCEEQPLLSRRLNVEVSRQIAQRCQINQIPMVFTSTDLGLRWRTGQLP
ncbi:MAG: sugar nucleotide-binding protein [Hahellaceae bacterium]|nr:sugar nucleotide-binding protein [Hahellaceae bacterium]